jgi:hypothetical protein
MDACVPSSRSRHSSAAEKTDDEEGGHQVNRVATRLDRPFEYRSADKMDSSSYHQVCEPPPLPLRTHYAPALYSALSMGERAERFKTFTAACAAASSTFLVFFRGNVAHYLVNMLMWCFRKT